MSFVDPKAIANVHDNLWRWANDYLGENPTAEQKTVVIEAIRNLQARADELQREMNIQATVDPEVLKLIEKPGIGYQMEFSHAQRSGQGNAAACWRVHGGVIPGTAVNQLTKEWWMTSEHKESPYASEIFTAHTAEAFVYASSLLNPNQLNWAQLDWIWF
ncbi:hypothetical protein H6G00_01515 [Leptolyngbya sp. FACHB-541]|uniref:hypothetical protein n=1 Tax=Leptolyngbya sp. FACHB-541 TaxID=2692810 RepID=UPI0016845C2F|nr:hypothetical protein [Leptolyngbya sp. FACHB-541]MBD1995308.1 hypothetical protein [Leptolyngbya sp. FACHB-541]